MATKGKSREELKAAFLVYHKANPHIFKLLKKFALEAKSRGSKEIRYCTSCRANKVGVTSCYSVY